jgi:hypothetical protein
MNKRTALILLALVVAGALAGVSFWKARREARLRESVAAVPSAPLPIVPIQDGKTIDFSSGKPEVRDTAEDKAAIGAAVKEIDEAVQNVTFAPTAPASQPAK